jgi:predicted phage tail protein
MLKKVKLYGELADFVGHKEFDVVINSTADAVKFLITNFPQLEGHMNDRYYKIISNNYNIGEDELHHPIGTEGVSIVPVISGAGGRGLGKIFLGALLIGGAFMFGGLKFGQLFGPIVQPGSLAAAGTFTKGAFYLGASLVLQGVSEMLFPLPTFDTGEEDPRVSFNFSGVQNTDRAGTSIPLCYGEITTGSVVISAGIDTQQIVAGDS